VRDQSAAGRSALCGAVAITLAVGDAESDAHARTFAAPIALT